MPLLLPLLLTAALAGQAAPSPAPSVPTGHTMRAAEDAPRLKATIADVAWLAGTWTGEGLGGYVEDAWSAPMGGAMVGYFRALREGKPAFYELLTILEHEGGVEMRLKHVNPDMTGWEEKNDFVTFRLLKVEKDALYFSGLTFRRTGPDAMDAFLAFKMKDGTTREEKITYRRAAVRH